MRNVPGRMPKVMYIKDEKAHPKPSTSSLSTHSPSPVKELSHNTRQSDPKSTITSCNMKTTILTLFSLAFLVAGVFSAPAALESRQASDPTSTVTSLFTTVQQYTAVISESTFQWSLNPTPC